MKKSTKPGALFNAHKAMAMKKKGTKSAKKHKYMPAFGSKATTADYAKYPSATSIKPTSTGQKALNRMNAGQNDLKMVKGLKFKGKKRKGGKKKHKSSVGAYEKSWTGKSTNSPKQQLDRRAGLR